MRRGECRRDGADLDSEHICDGAVLEIRVVAKEQRFTLAGREGRDPSGDAERVLTLPVRGRLVSAVERRVTRLACDSPGFVDDDRPDPAFERSAASERPPLADGCRKRCLNGVAAVVEVSADRRRHTGKRLEAVAVQRFKLCRRGAFRPHSDKSVAEGAFV